MKTPRLGTPRLLLEVVVAVLVALAASPQSARAQDERILSFHSDITVNPNASMLVRETIKVRSAGDQIRRGIYRDFPTRYKDRLGNQYVVGFAVLEVQRDGKPEPSRIERQSNGERVYIGRKNVYLDPGEYTYTLVYRTTRQLGFFPDHDELYWNVTGNGWIFPIDAASATVTLPKGIVKEALWRDAYTGPQGSAVLLSSPPLSPMGGSPSPPPSPCKRRRA